MQTVAYLRAEGRDILLGTGSGLIPHGYDCRFLVNLRMTEVLLCADCSLFVSEGREKLLGADSGLIPPFYGY